MFVEVPTIIVVELSFQLDHFGNCCGCATVSHRAAIFSQLILSIVAVVVGGMRDERQIYSGALIPNNNNYYLFERNE